MMKNYPFEIAKNQYFTTKNNSTKYIKSKKIIGFVMVVLSLFVFDGAFGQIAQRGTSTSDNNNGGSLIITKPTGVVSGDIMFANIATRGSNTLSNPTSSGWTLIDGRVLNAGNRWGALLYKIAGAAEPANYTFTLDADADGNVGTIVAFSGVDNTTPFDVATGTINTANSATVTANSITTTTANAAVIMFAMEVSNDRSHTGWTTTSPGVLTELYDDARTNRARVAAAWSIKATAGATGNGTATLSGAERNGGILIALRRSIPTITSLSATSGCPFSTFTINGTNLLSPTAVTIGGTAATINSSTATTISVTAGSGTTGTVAVTTAGGSATSASTYTISAIPGITTQPAATSVCTTGTTTFSVVATGATTYQWRRNGTDLTNVAPYSNVTTATLTITNPALAIAGNFDVIVGNAVPCTVTSTAVALTVNTTVPTASITPNPATAATGVCYAGTGAVTSVSWAATAGATSYDVYFGAGSLPGTVTANVATNSYTTGTLLASTTYFWQVVAKNACGNAVGSSTWTFTTAAAGCYCIPSSTTSTSYISGITSVGTLLDISNSPTGYSAGGYGNYTTTVIATQIPGGGINIDLAGPNLQYVRAYVDWDNNGFSTSDLVYTSGSVSLTTTSFGFIVQSAQAIGSYRMRIRTRSSSDSSTVDPCTTGYATGEAEDYTISVVSDCPAKISSVTNGFSCGVNTAVTLTAVGTAGTTEYRWYTSEVAVVPTATTLTGTWTTGLLPATTTYYVTAYNGSCETLTRTEIKATIRATANVSFSPAAPVVCGEDSVISVAASGDFTEEDLFTENFEGGLGGFSVVTPTNSTGQINAPWSVKTSTYTPTDTSVWRPAINSGTIGDKFAFTTSDYSSQTLDTQLVTTTSINSATFINLTLTFKHYYSDYNSQDTGTVDVSTDGGTTWTNTVITYSTDAGSASKFTNASIDLSAFAGQANLKFRFRYVAGWNDGWAIDDVRLYGTKPLTATTFSWTGGAVAYIDAATTIPYVAQNVSTIYIKPTPAQLSTASWTFTATATLANGCPAGQNITVTNLSKVWQGITSNWNDGNNWLPLGVPTAANCVIIADASVISGSGTNAYAKNLKVKSTGDLEIQSNNNLTVTDEVTVETDGILTVRNNASLVQINNTTNSGNIRMERTANMRRTDYVYWSSPVASFASSAISPASTLIYKWIPTIPANTNGWGNWTGGSETMTGGKGYIVRGPSAFTTTLQNFTATFTGVPNNGTISMGVQRGTYDGADYNTGVSSTLATNNDDNWNLLGNPYPSAINPTSFLAANTNLDGFVKVWSHGTAPSDATASPYYNTYTYNYSLSDYITYNGSGSTAGPGVNNIAAGQGFFTLMNHTSAATSETVTFNNSMRRDGSGNVYSNNQFYRNAQGGPTDASRIWIDLVAPNNSSARALVGYINGATNENDRLYDAFSDPKYNASFYSLLNNVPMEIQGRALPFNPADVVPMGFKTVTNGSHTIAIATVDGLFVGNQTNIYLEDRYLNVVHNLKLAPYIFTSNIGRFNDRFVLRYTENALGNNDYDYNDDVKIFASENINIASSSLAIKNVELYDVLGKTILERKNIGKNEITLTELKPTSTVLIVKVTLDNDAVITKKVIY